ncbi:MAG: hypothetical protein A3J37_07395 [Alphaproteobacteria bacterium RIFCSPHIGHO2_12_FULL_45_9]|nr:MAG: hypothetical protein A3B66_08535 [Alphaproteobacteria bacterium RIFCSPHIGHO2_02_FULL_46_13]OFW95548.1 MAG: hypothetical protein A3J37_07395 [Alphaproteobacteria bacterium RIFCSPHIGHO2_12_FULL_45_9]
MKIESIFKSTVHIFSIIFMIVMVSVWVKPLMSQTSQSKIITSKELIEFLSKNRVGSSPDYAFVKNGNDYLAIFTGYADDRQTCLEAAQEYNGDPSLSRVPGTYGCIQLNE